MVYQTEFGVWITKTRRGRRARSAKNTKGFVAGRTFFASSRFVFFAGFRVFVIQTSQSRIYLSFVPTQPEGARHFIDRNALCPSRDQTPDYALKAAKVPGT
jgi:hypothetical protein